MKKLPYFLLCLSNLFSQHCAEEVYCCKSGATECGGLTFQGSYLYMQAKEDNLKYVQFLTQTGLVPGGFPTQIDINLSLPEPDISWSSGFQIGAGYVLSLREGWDLTLNWSSLNSKGSSFCDSNDPTLNDMLLKPVWIPLLMGTVAFTAEANWKVKYNTLDIMAGRDFFSGRWFSLHPQAGVRIGWIRQYYDVAYDGAYGGFGNPIVDTGINTVSANWKYSAAGIRLGTNMSFHITSDFALQGNLFGSLLYGKFNLHEFFDGTIVIYVPPAFTPASFGESINFNDNYYRVRPALDMELGFQYQHFFNRNRQRIKLGAYYAFWYWFSQNILVNQNIFLDAAAGGNSYVANLSRTGDLQIQGLRFNLAFDF